uniref:Uncharacterized protein n=1 Tax=Setaria viridis TaxID=4556 RepID=A0A4U6VII4_SETVI|nr:hypothetical protein SEVIR_3G288500v2 [Setaria viridis]
MAAVSQQLCQCPSSVPPTPCRVILILAPSPGLEPALSSKLEPPQTKPSSIIAPDSQLERFLFTSEIHPTPAISLRFLSPKATPLLQLHPQPLLSLNLPPNRWESKFSPSYRIFSTIAVDLTWRPMLRPSSSPTNSSNGT